MLMKKRFFTLLLAIVAGFSAVSAASFVGFEATNDNKLGNQIHSGGIIQNMVNTTLVETDATKHKYNINLISGGEGTFQMGGITFAFTNDEAGKTAYKTYDTYIQPNGVDREIRIPTTNGEQVNIVLVEACSGMLVDGVSYNFVEGSNLFTANGNSIIVKNPSNKPKISAILSLGSSGNTDPDPEPINGIVKIGDYYYNLDSNSKTAEVTKDSYVPDCYSALTAVNIPSSVTYNSVNYNVTSIGNSAFMECRNITSVIIPNSVTSIGDWAFLNCWNMTSLTISSSVVSIGSDAFLCQSANMIFNITEIHYTGSIEEWCSNTCLQSCLAGGSSNTGYSLYINDINVVDLTIPNTITSLGDYAFEKCSGLRSVVIPSSVISIGRRTFNKCKNLSSFTIGENVTTIGNDAFSGCSELTNIKVHNGNPKYDSRNNCNAIIETTANKLILGCKNTTIPNTITSIGEFAFDNCTSLASITIPNSVNEIEYGAFSGCIGLTSVTCLNTTPPAMDDDVFYEVDCSNTPLYVPAESINAYKAAEQWKEFNPIQAAKSGEGIDDVIGDKAKNTKFIREGKLLIEKNGKTYNVIGAELK